MDFEDLFKSKKSHRKYNDHDHGNQHYHSDDDEHGYHGSSRGHGGHGAHWVSMLASVPHLKTFLVLGCLGLVVALALLTALLIAFLPSLAGMIGGVAGAVRSALSQLGLQGVVDAFAPLLKLFGVSLA